MKIGIDLDGVVFDSESWFRAYSIIFDTNIGGKGVKNADCILAEDRYGWTNAEIEQYYEGCKRQIQEEGPLMPYAKYVLDKLAEKHQIYFITRRGIHSNGSIIKTKERLRKEKIKYDEIFFGQESKLETCKKLGVDIMIDDNQGVVKEISENNIKCLYFRNINNLASPSKNIIEVQSWGEIYRYFFGK